MSYNFLDKDNNIVGPIDFNTGLGRKSAANCRSFAMDSETKTAIDTLVTNSSDLSTPSPVIGRCPNYETVAASQTDQVMGASGAAGDILSHVLIVPATTSPGAVTFKDGSGSAITIFTGGTNSVTTLIPFAVPLGIVATTNLKISTGLNVSAIGFGKFS